MSVTNATPTVLRREVMDVPILKGGHYHHGTEGLLLGYKRVVFHICEDGWLHEEALSVHLTAATHQPSSLLHTSCNIVQ